MSKSYNIIGSGFSGLSAAVTLAFSGENVNVLEKHQVFGGRARQFKEKDFVFDMGPSWYWMADVFERFFKRFGKKTSDYYNLIELNPGFQIIFDKDHTMKISSDWNEILELFESYEKGAADSLVKFMNDAEVKYNIGMQSLVYQPGISYMELIRKDILLNLGKMSLFTSYRKHVAKYFKNPFLKQLLEFPVLFLGTAPSDTPALYSLMAYSGIKKGTFYPEGGFFKVIESMVSLCREFGVEFHNNQNVKEFNISSNKVDKVITDSSEYSSDYVICSADYNYFDQQILPKKYRNYSQQYWDKRILSPSCLIFYLGINKKLAKLEHHNLFFDRNIDDHVNDIYNNPRWPEEPLFYACCPSKTDSSVAPKGSENLFLLMPLAAGINDTNENRKKFFKKMINRLEVYCDEPIGDNIVVQKSYCINDFQNDYNAFKGNAYGLANTLLQTANLKPKINNKHLSNLYFTGQLTVPGPGVPPSLISGQLVADYILKIKNKF